MTLDDSGAVDPTLLPAGCFSEPLWRGAFPVFAIRPDYLVAHGLSHRSHLIALSAIISAAEIGFFSVNETRLRALADAGGKRAALVLSLRSNPQRLLSIIMIGDRLVDTGAASFATIIALRLFGSEALAIVIGVLTFVLLIFGDIVPKTLAAKHALTVVLAMAYPVYWVQQLMKPILLVLEPVINALTGGKGVTVPHVSEEEVKIMLDEGGRAGMIETRSKIVRTCSNSRILPPKMR